LFLSKGFTIAHANQARAYEDPFEEQLVERSDLLLLFEVCTLKPHEIGVIRKRRGKGFITTLVPIVNQLP
jgi:hypothetical protein